LGQLESTFLHQNRLIIRSTVFAQLTHVPDRQQSECLLVGQKPIKIVHTGYGSCMDPYLARVFWALNVSAPERHTDRSSHFPPDRQTRNI